MYTEQFIESYLEVIGGDRLGDKEVGLQGLNNKIHFYGYA